MTLWNISDQITRSTWSLPGPAVVGRFFVFDSYQFPVLSFFTGAGFLDMGFMKAGFKVVWHNEYNPAFADGFLYGMRTWCTGIGLSHNELKHPTVASIEDLCKEDIVRAAFGGKHIPPDFGIIGGPPCPDFSIAGKNRGETGENGRLSRTYVGWISVLQPTFFLFENVPGILRTAKHRAFFEELREILAPDYATDFRVLNALDYGVPQDRERLLLVGVHRKWLRKSGKDSLVERQAPWFPFPVPKHQEAKKTYEWPGQSEFGHNGGQPNKETPLELMVGTHILGDAQLPKLENSRDCFVPYSKKFLQICEGDDSRKSFKRLHRYRYSPTAAYGNNEVHLHPTEPRRLTVREAMRIQSVPDDYALPPYMSLTDKFKTVGNGVPVVLAEAMARAIRDFLTK